MPPTRAFLSPSITCPRAASLQIERSPFQNATHNTALVVTGSSKEEVKALPLFVFYQDAYVTLSLTRHPITNGHTVLVINSGQYLMTLSEPTYLELMSRARFVAQRLRSIPHVERVALMSDGGSVISLVPLRGVHAWSASLSSNNPSTGGGGSNNTTTTTNSYGLFPGYATTQAGPSRLADTHLDELAQLIAHSSGRSFATRHDMDTTWLGHSDDTSAYARIVRGEVLQWRIWEDAGHVAFLDPAGSSPGYTILLPRQHLHGDVFCGLVEDDYRGLARAAHEVARILCIAFRVARCGVFFEASEEDSAHVKMVPMLPTAPPMPGKERPAVQRFMPRYDGFLTTQPGMKVSPAWLDRCFGSLRIVFTNVGQDLL